MMTTRFFSGASLFALLIVDICCLPLKKGSDPSYGSTSTNTAPGSELYYRAPSGHSSSGAVMPHNVPSSGVYTSYDAVPQPGPGVSQPAGDRRPAPSVGSSSSSGPASSGPAFSGYRGTPVGLNPASSAQPGADFQSGPRDISWAVPPPSLLSAGEEMSTGPRGGFSSQPENVSPPEPMYQAGELSRYKHSFEHGDSERETEEQGWLPAPPPPLPLMAESEESAGHGFTSPPRPGPNMGGFWVPYPYYDYMFLTGQYPPGTYTHSSSNFEQGADHWQDVHYERYYAPSYPVVAQQPEAPKTPVKKPVVADQAASSHGGFRQPVRSQAGGHNMVKFG